MKQLARRTVVASVAATFAGSGALVLGACAAGGGTEAPKVRPAVSMEYWSRWSQADRTDVEEKRVAEWNAANAPTKFTRTGLTGDYIEKLNVAAAAGTMPDTYTVGGSGIPNFSLKGVALVGIDKYPAVKKELPDFFDPTIEASKYQGKLNGLPYIVDIRTMIARKDLMVQAGLDPAKWPDTWDQFREAARRMTKRNGVDFTQVGFNVPKGRWNSHDLFMTLIVQGGEQPFNAELTKPNLAGAAGRQALQLMVDLINRDQVDTFKPPAAPSGVNPMVAGLQASTWDSAGPVNAARLSAPDVAANMIVMPMPKLKQRWTYMGGTWLMASNAPKDPATAVDLLLYLTAAKHADAINSIQNAVPPRKSAGSSDYVKQPLIKPFYDAIVGGWTYPNHGYYTEIRDVITDEVIAALQQAKGVEAALDTATRGVQEYLTKK
jgi:multiple sugar transport system substrate-binding protein